MRQTGRDFHPNYSKWVPYGRMLYCKECGKEIANELFEQNAHFETFTRNLCITFQMPYFTKAKDAFYDVVYKGTTQRQIDYVLQYLKVLKELDTPEEYWSDLSGNTYHGLDILKVAKPTSPGDVETLQQLEKDWGAQDNIYDYVFLEEKFHQYTDGQELTPAARNTFRYLCAAELDVKKLKAAGKDSKPQEEKVMKYYKTLKLDNFSFSGDVPLYQKLIEDWAVTEEQKEPLEWVDEHLEDICGFRADNEEIMRCIGNYAVGMRQYPTLTFDDVNGEDKKHD
jgi:hypothetical protein